MQGRRPKRNPHMEIGRADFVTKSPETPPALLQRPKQVTWKMQGFCHTVRHKED